MVGGGSFALSDIKVGDGSKVSLSAISAEFATSDGDIEISAQATLNINLPSNQQTSTIAFTIDNSGDLQADVDNIELTISKATLAMQEITLTTDGLTAGSASLTLPSNLSKGAPPSIVRGVQITANGLEIEGGTIGLPEIYLANSKNSQIRFYELQATINTGVVASTHHEPPKTSVTERFRARCDLLTINPWQQARHRPIRPHGQQKAQPRPIHPQPTRRLSLDRRVCHPAKGQRLCRHQSPCG